MSFRLSSFFLPVDLFSFFWELFSEFPVNFRSAELHELCETEVYSYDHFFATCVCVGPGANLEAYVNTVNSIPLLTPEQERELAESLYYEQDLGAARQMVLAHLRFVVHIARSYSGYGSGSG